jgi:hypothetical protein
MVGVLIGVAPRHDSAHAGGEGVEDPGAWLAEPEAVEHLAWDVAVSVPVEEGRSVAEPSPGAATGDVPVDRDRQCAKDLAHLRDPFELGCFRANAMIQFVFNASPPSSENACSLAHRVAFEIRVPGTDEHVPALVPVVAEELAPEHSILPSHRGTAP